MLRNLLIIISLGLSSGYAQDVYSYSFSGTVGDVETLELKLKNIEGVNMCKVRLKPESSKGEIIIDIAPYVKKEGEEPYNPDTLIQLKRTIIEEGLQPIELNQIKL